MDQKTLLCETCGGQLPPKHDPRGRAARFCSAACRNAAARKREADQTAAAIEQARAEGYEAGKRAGWAEGHAAGMAAGREAAAREPTQPALDIPAGPNRAQRRHAERMARRRGT